MKAAVIILISITGLARKQFIMWIWLVFYVGSCKKLTLKSGYNC